MNIDEFESRLTEKFGYDRSKKYNFFKSFESNILINTSDNKWMLFNDKMHNKLHDGAYRTVRVGLGGIYEMTNFWNSKKDDFEIKVADNSHTILVKDFTEDDFKDN